MTTLYERLEAPGTLWFEASGPDGRHGDSLLFADPLELLPLYGSDDIRTWFSRLESWLGRGCCIAGWLGYEAGAMLDPALSGCAWPDSGNSLLGWFAAYRQPERIDRDSVSSADESAASGRFLVSGLEFDLSGHEYLDRIAAIREEIAAGNVYQVNFTGRFRFGFEGRPEALYAAMKRRQPSAWSAFLNTGERIVLSFSPELFFTVDGWRIETMPMKGTAPRGNTPAEDIAEKDRLFSCEKNRAENLMIVDLLRNDLGRVCMPGSVETSGLFETRTWPTLHQMVSTVRGELREGIDLYGLFSAMFPSGSVTGAPKVRAMHLIRSLEKSPRGIYTGSVGFIMPGGRMAFNVAIRTIGLSGGSGVYGSGGGIVWDSDAHREYHECMLKARILSDLAGELPGVFETILWNGAYLLLDDHLERLGDSARVLGLALDREEPLPLLDDLAAGLRATGGVHRVRLTLDGKGTLSATSEPFSPDPEGRSIRVCVSSERVDSGDPLLRHKLISRDRFDHNLRAAIAGGFQEVLFLNERDEVTEGAISNVVVRIDGSWYTPPLSSGLLDGVFRRYLLRTRPWISEREVTLDDLRRADRILVCNALRGVRHAELAVEG
jgi:para-aminobenzoate synthetase/4-amino-4-deoxychorismate lyase